MLKVVVTAGIFSLVIAVLIGSMATVVHMGETNGHSTVPDLLQVLADTSASTSR